MIPVTLEYPVPPTPHATEVVRGDGIAHLARAAEEVGFSAIAFTEHPAPSRKWLESGGHGTLDVAAALGFAAAVTNRVRLMSHATILPFHNPYAVAKAFSTLDVLSNGRLTVVVGSGYLRSEFLAMGAAFEDRGALLDESLDVIRACWSGRPVTRDGRFPAREVISHPGPVQDGGPPILVGGNGRRARMRAARHDGWSPLMLTPETARSIRTPSTMATIAQLSAGIAEVREAAAEAGRTRPEIQVQPRGRRFPIDGGTHGGQSEDEHRDELTALAEAGVDRVVVQIPGDSIARAEDAVRRYAETFFDQ